MRREMMIRRALLGASLVLASSVACSEPHGGKPHGSDGQKGDARVVENPFEGSAVSGLPFSQGRSFTSLDEYLAFLQKRGAYDVPWYREIRPGVYELVSRRGPGAEPQIFTREQLKEKFSFAR